MDHNYLKLETLLIDKTIISLSKKSGLIKPLDPNSLSGCSYDLRAGQILRSRNKMSSFDLSTEYVVESGECVTVETLEEVNIRTLPLFGVIVNKHSILAKGFFHPITTVDPG